MKLFDGVKIKPENIRMVFFGGGFAVVVFMVGFIKYVCRYYF